MSITPELREAQDRINTYTSIALSIARVIVENRKLKAKVKKLKKKLRRLNER